MAIKIGGTTVIDDSRNLVNIASGAGLSKTETSISDAHSYTGANVYHNQQTGELGTSVPNSNYVWASRTLTSGTKLMSCDVVTGSGITDYKPAGYYYGATLAVALWNGSSLQLLKHLHTGQGASGGSLAATTVRNKSLTTGLFAVDGGETIYGLVVATYNPPSFTGGLSWSAGTVTMDVLEFS